MWDSFLQLVNLLVSPDWNSLVGLVPLGVSAAVVLYLAWQARRALTAPPRVARPLPALPAPDGVHHGASASMAPIAAAFGAACFLFSLLFVKVGPRLDAAKHPIPDSTTVTIEPFGGVVLVFGIVVFVGSLLIWGRQGMRDYDALEAPLALPARTGTPPEGVHVPAPTFRPLLIAIAVSVLLLSLAVRALPIAVAGLVMLVVAGLGWLRDARAEFGDLVHADIEGHAPARPHPRMPVGTLSVFAGLLVLAVLVTAGIVPPKSSTGGASPAPAGGGAGSSAKPAASANPAASGAGASLAPAGSAAPAGSGAPAGSAAPAASAGASGGGGGSATRIQLVAQGIAFATTDLTAPANTPFQIVFTNNDAGTPHNVAIHQGSVSGARVFGGALVTGVATQTYDVPALAAGSYVFVCEVHPSTMQGTLTVK